MYIWCYIHDVKQPVNVGDDPSGERGESKSRISGE